MNEIKNAEQLVNELIKLNHLNAAVLYQRNGMLFISKSVDIMKLVFPTGFYMIGADAVTNRSTNSKEYVLLILTRF